MTNADIVHPGRMMARWAARLEDRGDHQNRPHRCTRQVYNSPNLPPSI